MTPPAVTIDFVPSSAPTAGSVTVRSVSGPVGDLHIIAIEATDISNVFAAAFTLQVDPTVALYRGFDSSMSFLSSDGATIQAIVQETSSGVITVGLTRVASNGINITGTQELLQLTFARASSGGTGVLGFAANTLQDDQTPPQTIPGISWSGGNYVVN